VFTSRGLHKCSDWFSLQRQEKENFFGNAKKAVENLKENFFGIPKSSDTGRSSENVLGKFPECGAKFRDVTQQLQQTLYALKLFRNVSKADS